MTFTAVHVEAHREFSCSHALQISETSACSEVRLPDGSAAEQCHLHDQVDARLPKRPEVLLNQRNATG